MSVICDACGKTNRPNANFCSGCAAQLPGFSPTGPSALATSRATLGVTASDFDALAFRPPSHLPAGDARRPVPRAVAALRQSAELPMFWLRAAGLGMLLLVGFMAWYMFVTRKVDAPSRRDDAAAVAIEAPAAPAAPAVPAVPAASPAALAPTTPPAVERAARVASSAPTSPPASTSASTPASTSASASASASGDMPASGATASSPSTAAPSSASVATSRPSDEPARARARSGDAERRFSRTADGSRALQRDAREARESREARDAIRPTDDPVRRALALANASGDSGPPVAAGPGPVYDSRLPVRAPRGQTTAAADDDGPPIAAGPGPQYGDTGGRRSIPLR